MKTVKVLFLLMTVLVMTSCWGWDVNTSDENTKNIVSEWDWKTTSGVRHFPWKDFSIKIPAAWNIVTKDKQAVPTPKTGILELAITSTETKSGFANSLIILSQELEDYTSSKQYSIVNSVWAENEYLNYLKLSGKEFSFDDWEKSMLYIFEAKYSKQTPVLKFLQTAYVCNDNKAFFLTIALPTSLRKIKKYEKLLGTFSCKS